MAKVVKEFEYKLIEPVKYHKQGQEALGYKMTLKAPSPANRKHILKLKQHFIEAMQIISDKPRKATDNIASERELKGSDITNMLLIAGVDVNEAIDIFKELICSSNLAHVDDSQALTPFIFDNISIEDLENILGEYLKVFIVSSWLEKSNTDLNGSSHN